jgi:PAS domain S-box-containing protein
MPLQTHLESLFENATEGIILTDSRGGIIMVNPAAVKIFDYSAQELIGQSIDILIPDRFKQGHAVSRESFHQQPKNRKMGVGRDLFGKRKDGTDVPVEISLSHYKKNGETFVIAFIVDITMRKEIEKNLLKKQEELEAVSSDIRKLNAELEAKVGERTQILKEALQRLEESQSELKEALDKEKQLNEIKSRFVSIASHEFRTPLSTVLSSASLLSRYTAAEDQDKRERHIVKIKDSVKHLNDILEDFLSLGKLDEGKIVANPDDFNCKELIEDTAEELKGLLKNNQQINVSYTGSEIIYADKKLLKNILFNLLSNAIKFSDEGSVIQISGNIDNGSAAISVTDQGIGISENDQKHLFTSFFRGANASNIQGTGLGLHIVKRYADLLSGKVKLQSWLDKGTTVTIEFPSAADKIYL